MLSLLAISLDLFTWEESLLNLILGWIYISVVISNIMKDSRMLLTVNPLRHSRSRNRNNVVFKNDLLL